MIHYNINHPINMKGKINKLDKWELRWCDTVEFFMYYKLGTLIREKMKIV